MVLVGPPMHRGRFVTALDSLRRDVDAALRLFRRHPGFAAAAVLTIALAAYGARVYLGDEAQGPDPKIAAIEGVDNAPAYRGLAYIVFEDLPLAGFGNRVPVLTAEVIRRAPNASGRPALEDLVTVLPVVENGFLAPPVGPAFAAAKTSAAACVRTSSWRRAFRWNAFISRRPIETALIW